MSLNQGNDRVVTFQCTNKTYTDYSLFLLPEAVKDWLKGILNYKDPNSKTANMAAFAENRQTFEEYWSSTGSQLAQKDLLALAILMGVTALALLVTQCLCTRICLKREKKRSLMAQRNFAGVGTLVYVLIGLVVLYFEKYNVFYSNKLQNLSMDETACQMSNFTSMLVNGQNSTNPENTWSGLSNINSTVNELVSKHQDVIKQYNILFQNIDTKLADVDEAVS